MKKALILASVLFFCLAGSTQRLYYVYLQSEAGKPFFVKMDEKIFNASPAGYLILSDLRDSTYAFRIGFPGDSRDYLFTCQVAGKDHGFLIKDFKEKGWGLFDLQTLKVHMQETQSGSGGLSYTPKKQVTPFALMLAKAAGDPTLLQTAVFLEKEKKPAKPMEAIAKESKPKATGDKVNIATKDTEMKESLSAGTKAEIIAVSEKPVVENTKKEIPPVINNAKPSMDSAALNQGMLASQTAGDAGQKVDIKKPGSGPVTPVVKSETPVPENVTVSKPVVKGDSYPGSQIRVRSESSTTEGFGLVYIDEYGQGQKDTIRLLIPSDSVIPIAGADKKEETPARRFLDFDSGSTPVSEKETAIEASKLAGGDQEVTTGKKDTTTSMASSTQGTMTPVTQQKDAALEVSRMATENKAGADMKKETGQQAGDPMAGAAPPSLPPGASCKKAATEEDFLELRKRMAAETEEVKMVDEAEAFFKGTCFTTEQIKNLGVLFLRDVWKFRFFSSAYPYVIDPQQFPALRDQLTDSYYVERFQSILKKGF